LHVLEAEHSSGISPLILGPLRLRGAIWRAVGLAVQVQPSIKGRLVVKIMSSPVDLPLFEVLAKARPVRGSTVEVVIKTEEEPLHRQFFTRVGQLCGRPVAP
jgi:hypothetical protein